MKKKNTDTLHLVLIYKWYNMIASGEKKEEYRGVKWIKRIINQDAEEGFLGGDGKTEPFEVYGKLMPLPKQVVFHRGYSSTTMTFSVAGVDYGHGKPEWGAPVDKKVIILKLGNRIA